MCELDVPAMIHVSGSCNPALHATGAYYIAADTIAFMQLLEGDLFARFPTLRFIIPHGGGAVPYHWGRYRGLADMLGKPDLSGHLMNNVYFDTCVYHQPGINLLAEVIASKNILFGSEMVGAVRGIDPTTGQYFDDTKRYVDALNITPEQRHAIFEGNARGSMPSSSSAACEQRRHRLRALRQGFALCPAAGQSLEPQDGDQLAGQRGRGARRVPLFRGNAGGDGDLRPGHHHHPDHRRRR
jgi:hypothetical protein